MKIKVGEVVKNAVLTSKMTKGEIVSKLKKSRTWLTNILSQEEMELKYVLDLGKILGVDFGKSIPSLRSNLPVEAEIPDETADTKIMKLMDKLIEVQDKYMALMEDHINLLNKIKGQQ